MRPKVKPPRPRLGKEKILEKCLASFVKSGTLDLSLDELAKSVRVSKRMLIHYFGGKEVIERSAVVLLEDQLRARFRADAFPPGTTLLQAISALWEQTTHPEARGVLLLVMDLTRRAWGGSKQARNFYLQQQRLWVELLLKFSDDEKLVKTVLQLFQGAVLAYLVTGDRELGLQALKRFVTGQE
ncbi:TetR/AcrR family transcriptional regulator [Edaphobacter bradus]|uniref:TetR/AcrR family transcriptional regulator n=1 Tax=Edaphobacter bradus TaxID=2259016 RepID=UPI0021E034E3|nr:TetR/AcrR family transcriptional regulator [Edaphobacter bradus]